MDALASIQSLGYAVLPDLIDEDKCEQFSRKLDSACDRYSPLYASNCQTSTHGLDDKSGERVVYNLHNKDPSWFALFEHPDVISLLNVLLSEGSYKNADPFYLNNISARCPLRGNSPQQLHIDSRVAGLNRPLVINVLWMIDDFTEHNGATRVVPGSHRRLDFAEDGKQYEDEIAVVGRRGSAIVFDAGLWHGGGVNESGERRWGLALGYARWFLKPAFDFSRNTPASVFDVMSDSQRRLLGFDSLAPSDEFTRLRRRSEHPEKPYPYTLPKTGNLENAK